jgi:DNA-binding CsgD family transcriptional regulator
MLQTNNRGGAGLALASDKRGIGARDLVSRLTGAERRVLALVSRAMTNKEIAAALGISPATVKRHLENLLKKLELRNRVEAAICGLLSAGCQSGGGSGCRLALWVKEKTLGD